MARAQWGFQGYVVSDCGAVSDIHNGHKFAPTLGAAAVSAVKAGTDLTCGTEYRTLVDEVKAEAGRALGERAGVKPLARILSAAAVGVEPRVMGIGPAEAIPKLFKKTGVSDKDIAFYELNEAFAAQSLACVRTLGIDPARVNVNGGAIALGHPLACTGVRLTLTLARELRRSGLRYGISSACIGGGQGIALLLENPDAA